MTISNLTKTKVTLPLAGVLIGYFLLHPISMFIMKNRFSVNIFVKSFSLEHFNMALYFSLLGLVLGVLVALLQAKVLNQKVKLNEQNILLKQSNIEKETLLRILTHDLINLIGSSNALLKMMIEKPEKYSDSKSAEIDLMIVNNLSEATSLIDVSRQLISIESGKIEIELNECNICKIVEEIGATFSSSCLKKGLTIKLDMPESPVISKIEPTIFKHTIIGNLLSNAVKFSEEKEFIHVKLEKKTGNVEIKIKNMGPGIAPERLETIFSVSRKTTTLGTSGEKGTGLGLPLVYKFVKLMDGTVFAESEPILNQGDRHITTFKIVLPMVVHHKTPVCQ